MEWFERFKAAAAASDRLAGTERHLALIVAGLFGEAGSIAAEAKKIVREGPAYPAYRERLVEEVGDFLWYFTRLADAYGFEPSSGGAPDSGQEQDLVSRSLELGAAVAGLLGKSKEQVGSNAAAILSRVWSALEATALRGGIALEHAAERNLAKIESRWPANRQPYPLFDAADPAEDQLPRRFTLDFKEIETENPRTVHLRYRDIGIGDRITDNIGDPDGYRFHDVIHMAHAAFLGWSPVMRTLLRCKRRSNPAKDRDQDGARATLIEEAVSAVVFSRAKRMKFFAGASQVDFDLLKTIKEFVAGYEVDEVPMWQWEQAILKGYHVFRLLRENGGGRVSWDLQARTLEWSRFEP